MAKAAARHILVKTEEACQQIKEQIEGGADFADMAKQHSDCPSKRDGGEVCPLSFGSWVRSLVGKRWEATEDFPPSATAVRFAQRTRS